MTALASLVDTARLWARHMSIARHGATAAGGVNRQALSTAECDARSELIEMGRSLDLKPFTDAAGNFFLRMEGNDRTVTPVITGSHIDSQPTGGKFDGIYGVLAGLEAIAAMRAANIQPKRSIEVVAWMNEEGSRFAPGMMGSAAFAGATPLATFLDVADSAGITVREALASMRAAFHDVPERALGFPISAYVETHIEQGPILELEGYSVGVVSGIQGKRTFRVTVRGEEAHAGTTPRAERKDALLAATAIIQALALAMHDDEDLVRFTVGRLDIQPNAPSVVPARAIFSIDLRHPDSTRLTELGDAIAAICMHHADRCEVAVQELTTAMSLSFPLDMRETIRNAAWRCRLPTLDILSAAGHDARFLHGVAPTGMIFVPCKDGVSHNEAESATADDLAAGARVLAEVLVDLAGR